MEGAGQSVMTGLVTALQGVLNADQMFSNLTTLIPVIGGVLIFSFTYKIIKRMIKGASNGKTRI